MDGLDMHQQRVIADMLALVRRSPSGKVFVVAARAMLARALYRRPKILFLDEATSHLDVENEIRISEAIAALDITRIMIAHRPQTIAIADRVMKLENGRFVEVQRETSENSATGMVVLTEPRVLSFPEISGIEAANSASIRHVAGGLTQNGVVSWPMLSESSPTH